MSHRRRDRIPPVLAEIWAAWERNPDLRLTQLLWNVRSIETTPQNTITSFYNLEDDTLVERIKQQYGTDKPDSGR